jgi:hypothetical protein
VLSLFLVFFARVHRVMVIFGVYTLDD